MKCEEADGPSDSVCRLLRQIVSGITLRWWFMVWLDLIYSDQWGIIWPASRNPVNFTTAVLLASCFPGWVYGKLLHVRRGADVSGVGTTRWTVCLCVFVLQSFHKVHAHIKKKVGWDSISLHALDLSVHRLFTVVLLISLFQLDK